MGLDCRLDATHEGDHVALALTVRNDGDEAVDLTFPTAQRVDVAVRDGDTEIWRYGDDRLFAQVVGTDRLVPGETATYAVEWLHTGVEPGAYTATASLAADVDCVATATVTVEA